MSGIGMGRKAGTGFELRVFCAIRCLLIRAFGPRKPMKMVPSGRIQPGAYTVLSTLYPVRQSCNGLVQGANRVQAQNSQKTRSFAPVPALHSILGELVIGADTLERPNVVRRKSSDAAYRQHSARSVHMFFQPCTRFAYSDHIP